MSNKKKNVNKYFVAFEAHIFAVNCLHFENYSKDQMSTINSQQPTLIEIKIPDFGIHLGLERRKM